VDTFPINSTQIFIISVFVQEMVVRGVRGGVTFFICCT